MSRILSTALLITIVFSTTYFWYAAAAICPIPISYQIGELDERFGFEVEEVNRALAAAETLWEEETGLDLFLAADSADMIVNFVFDERQEFINAEQNFSAELDDARNITETIEQEYEELVARYTKAQSAYQNDVETYETALQTYNDEVAKWNNQGGAPEAVFTQLNQTKIQLDTEKQQLNLQLRNINTIADKINQLTTQANQVVERYNENVEVYNHSFSETTEFTQGDYRGSEINIYQFSSYEELVLVLAHEFGHALGIGHVENEQSIMFNQMNKQSLELGISIEDTAAFVRVCGDGSLWSKLTRLSFW